MAPTTIAHIQASRRKKPVRSHATYEQPVATQKAVTETAQYEYFVTENQTVCITRCVSSSKSITIPESIDGWEVVELAPDSFANLFSVESIACPGCMKRIGDRAFSGCNTLRELHLNEGLQHIGSSACANCWKLNAITLPSSVETLGCNITGNACGRWRSLGHTSVTVDPENQHLFIDENLVVYAREEQGLALMDASSFPGGELRVAPGTHRICAFACSGHGNITSVVLPEGLLELGEGCFSGCYKLTSMNFPSTLKSWGDNALSNTRLTSVHIPAGCVYVTERSFNFGASDETLYGRQYEGTVTHITVDPQHPFLTMMCGLLCTRITSAGEDAYRGLACESKLDELNIPSCVKSLAAAALSGVTKCGTLHIHEGLNVSNSVGLLPNGKVERLIIDLKTPIQGQSQVNLEIPEGVLGKELSEGSLTAPALDLKAFLQAYDAAVIAEHDDLARARHYSARLASGVYLQAATEKTARGWLAQNLSSVCIHFGTRNYWDGFSQLVDCGVLNETAINSAVEILSNFNDAAAVAYLLQLKHTHFTKACWDYDL